MPGPGEPRTPLDKGVWIATGVSWLALAGVIGLVWPEFGAPWSELEMLFAAAGFFPLLLLWSCVLDRKKGDRDRRGRR